MLKKVVVAVAAAMACASVAQAAGNEWEVHGYGRLGGQWDGKFNNNMTTFGKNDYKTVTSNDENNNQVEFTVSKKTKVKGGVWSNFGLRAEYGNVNAGDQSAFISSQGSEAGNQGKGGFEVKEAYIELGGFDFLGTDTKIWTGQRFLNRSASLLSKEFWKQSSGVGFGFENGKFGAAMVSADAGNTSGSWNSCTVNNNQCWMPAAAPKATNQTLTSFDFWYSGLEVPGGNLQFDLKYMNRANTPSPTGSSNANTGVGGAVTYNTNWYGVKGWTQNVVAYGTGLAANRGVNFGSWSDGFTKDSKALFVTTYGVADLTDMVQLGSEFTYFKPKDSWGQKSVERYIVALQPSIKLNSFSRVILTGSYGSEKLASAAAWGRTSAHDKYVAVDAAVAFTVNSDYFGRPQIKPFVTYVKGNTNQAAGNVGIDTGKKDQMTFGVEGEIWF